MSMTADAQELKEWAFIFDTFGRDALRNALYDSAMKVSTADVDTALIEISHRDDGRLTMALKRTDNDDSGSQSNE